MFLSNPHAPPRRRMGKTVKKRSISQVCTAPVRYKQPFDINLPLGAAPGSGFAPNGKIETISIIIV